MPVLSVDSPSRWRLISHRTAMWTLVLAIAATALVAGLILRRYAWDQTEPIRYTIDINNAYRQGSAALDPDVGYINRYDERTSTPEGRQRMWLDLDYAPGRLAVATLWTRWVREQPEWADSELRGVGQAQQDFFFYARARQLHLKDGPYELMKPLLMLNIAGEVISCIAMFFLVRRYTSGKGEARGMMLGLLSAMFLWFNPSVISNAHCWPQWDSWVLPFFLWALVLACWNWWFTAGALIALGSMFKGQILFAAPLFLLWPLFQGRIGALCRWIAGLLTSAAAVTAVWLVRTPGTNPTGRQFIPGSVNVDAVHWVIWLTVLFVSLLPLRFFVRWSLTPVVDKFWYRRSPQTPALRYAEEPGQTSQDPALRSTSEPASRNFLQYAHGATLAHVPSEWRGPLLSLLSLAISSAILLYVCKLHPTTSTLLTLSTIATLLIICFGPLRAWFHTAAAWIAVGLFSCMPLYHTSSGWFDLGFAYGTHHFEDMARGDPNNLPELMMKRWGWGDLMEPAITLPAGQWSDSVANFMESVDPGVKADALKDEKGQVGLPLKYLLVGVFGLSLILCSIAAGVHDRTRSPRFLLAISTPYLVFFAVMTQMHQRYLLWGAGISAAAVAVSPGFAVLNVLMSIIACGQEIRSMLLDAPGYTGYTVFEVIDTWHPGIAWVVILTAAIFLYSSMKFDRPGKSAERKVQSAE